MTSSFALYLGIFLTISAAASGLVFRLTSLPLAIRIAVPAVLVALACWTPTQVVSLLGYPVVTAYEALPPKAELLAFIPHENKDPKTVDLILSENGGDPRMYRTELTEGMKKMLKDASEEQRKGNRTEIGKKKLVKKPAGQTYVDTDGGQAPYELLDNAFALPPKEDRQ